MVSYAQSIYLSIFALLLEVWSVVSYAQSIYLSIFSTPESLEGGALGPVSLSVYFPSSPVGLEWGGGGGVGGRFMIHETLIQLGSCTFPCRNFP